MPRKRPRAEREMQLVRVSRPDAVAEVYAEYRSWDKIRFALYAVFRNCAEVGRMTALYGQRTDEQAMAAVEYAREHGSTP